MYPNLYLLEQLTRARQLELQQAATPLLPRLRLALRRPAAPVAPAPTAAAS